jgi:hypothetical protein
MDQLNLALKYAKRKQLYRLKVNGFRRRQTRLKSYPDSYFINHHKNDQSVTGRLISITLDQHREANSIKSDIYPILQVIDNFNEKAETDDEISSTINELTFDDIIYHHEKNDDILPLHPYTTTNWLSFSQDLIQFIRQANIAKANVQRLICLIKSALPQPNTLPKSYSQILDALSGITLFLLSIHYVL